MAGILGSSNGGSQEAGSGLNESFLSRGAGDMPRSGENVSMDPLRTARDMLYVNVEDMQANGRVRSYKNPGTNAELLMVSYVEKLASVQN